MKDGVQTSIFDEELWIIVPGYPNYEISSFGRIRNISTGAIVAPYSSGRGKCSVTLYGADKVKHTVRVDNLVYKAFINTTFDNLYYIHHLNGDPMDCSLANLERKSLVDLRNPDPKRGVSRLSYRKPVVVVEDDLYFASIRQCADYLGATASFVGDVVDKPNRTCKRKHVVSYKEVV